MIWDVSRFVAFDTETHKIQDGLAAPPLVVGSTAWFNPGWQAEGRLLHPATSAYDYAKRLLNSDRIIVGANIAYDMVVLCAEGQRRGDPTMMDAVVRAYTERRVLDVLIASALEAIFDGSFGNEKNNDVCYPSWDRRAGQKVKKASGKIAKRFSLEVCTDIVLGRTDAKENDFWRLRYAILEHVPLDHWPADAKQYPVDDAVNTLEVAAAQVLGYRRPDGETPPHRNLDDMADQAETAFWEAMGAARGIRADRDRVEALAAKAEEMHARVVEQFAQYGLYHVGGPQCQCGIVPCSKAGKPWIQAIKRRVAIAYGANPAAGCMACGGCGRVTGASGSAVFCERCDGTGLDLTTSTRIPSTPAGGISKDRDALMESGDDVIAALGDNVVEKVRDTYLPYVRGGIDVPITLRPNVLLETGRSSYDGLIQLFMRQPLMENGKPIMFRGLPLGVRQCLRARPGYYFFSIDYSAIELCCLAQITYWLFGKSVMRDIINDTQDPGFLHSSGAARMLGISDDEMRARLKAKDKKAKDFRQAQKPFSFGVPGGMGGAKIVLTNRKAAAGETVAPDGTRYAGIRFCILVGDEPRCGTRKVSEWKGRQIVPTCQRCLEVAEYQLRPAFLSTYPEVAEYLAWSNRECNRDDEWSKRVYNYVPASIRADGYTRIRGGVDYCSRANGGFQQLNADGTKAASRTFGRECYGYGPMGRESPLYGTRPIMMVHDELFGETPQAKAHAAVMRGSEIMVADMRRYLPDVYVSAPPALAAWWSKDMEERRDEHGMLIPWDIEAIAEDIRAKGLTAHGVSA